MFGASLSVSTVYAKLSRLSLDFSFIFNILRVVPIFFLCNSGMQIGILPKILTPTFIVIFLIISRKHIITINIGLNLESIYKLRYYTFYNHRCFCLELKHNHKDLYCCSCNCCVFGKCMNLCQVQ